MTREERIAKARAAMDAHIGYSKQLHASGTELPWCWSDTGEKSNDFAIGTGTTCDSDDAPMAEGYVESARMDAMEVIPIDEVCTAENASFADAELIVRMVNAAPDLFALIDEQAKELERLTAYLVDTNEGEWCGLDCGTFILEDDDRYVVTFEDDDNAACCANCYASLKKDQLSQETSA